MITTELQFQKTTWLDTEKADRVIARNQYLLYWISKALGLLVFKSKVIKLHEHDMIHGSRYIIASNHQSLFDTHIICSQIPWNGLKRMGRLNYFAGNRLMAAPILRSIFISWGAFPAKKSMRYPYGIDYASQQLAKGQAVMIFPEARRSIRGEARARHGIEVLAREPHVMVIPVHIEWELVPFWRRLSIGIGKPIDASKMTAQEILDYIYSLPVTK